MYRCIYILMYMNRRIGHLDADCFYVSCERVRHGCLCGQAVGVLSNQGACVIAKSYELKARGVTTGMPIWDALPLCPEAIFVKRDFEWYEVLSRRIREIAERFSPPSSTTRSTRCFSTPSDIDFPRPRNCSRLFWTRRACRSAWAFRSRRSWPSWRRVPASRSAARWPSNEDDMKSCFATGRSKKSPASPGGARRTLEATAFAPARSSSGPTAV